MYSLAAFTAMAPDQRYISSVNDITGYNSAIASQKPPPNLPGNQPGIAAAEQALQSAQSTSLQWFNQVYPACLNVPQTIVSQAGSITASLSELTTLASQLASDPGNSQLASALVTATNTLIGQVQTLQSNCASLGTSLTGYTNAMQSTVQQLCSAVGALQASMCSQQAQLNNDEANLDYLEHKPCPSSSDINAAEGVVQNDIQGLQATNQFLNQIGPFSNDAGSALAGLSYLAGTWTQIASMAGDSVAQLQRVTSDPPVVLQLDLQSASQSWQSLVNQLDSITQQAQTA